ncbi:Bacterial regulatory protein, luxR family [Enhygromyxa salina]|uniref:Bacterial regulatory protein, luxR family n=1 Tax=Enhygromyxa salina TaxID=215803 RepID=A0A2S9XBC6_9BACT|nr:Bacterial regulatory protein, luxR family [Enhygromyxa salina]
MRTGELIKRLVDSLERAFRLGEYELQVVHHVLFGRSCGAIAWRLGIRETTVHKHLHRLFAKTRCDSRRELYDLALRLAARDEIVGSFGRTAAA